MSGKFIINKAKDGQFYFNLKESNGQMILTSEMYKTKSNAENGITSIRKNATDDSKYERKEANNGKPYFVLKARNNHDIVRSRTYSSELEVKNGVELVKKIAPKARYVKSWEWFGNETNHRAVITIATIIGVIVAVATLIIAVM